MKHLFVLATSAALVATALVGFSETAGASRFVRQPLTAPSALMPGAVEIRSGAVVQERRTVRVVYPGVVTR